MKQTIGVLALLCALGVPSSARQCPARPTPGNAESFEFVNSVVDSLSHLKTATTELHEQSTKTEKAQAADIVGTLTDMMTSMKRASEEYECAATLVGSFGSSKDEMIGPNAQALFGAYMRLKDLNDQLLKLLRDSMDGKGSPAEQADKMSSNSVDRDETYRALIQLNAYSTYALVIIPKNEKETTNKLNITVAQKDELTRKLERDYGQEIKKGFVAGLRLADSPAYLMYEFFNKGWQFSPTK